MAYNSYFPMGYAPQQYMYPQTAPASSVSQANGGGSNLIWVQGEGGAKSYLVAPNSTVALWDSETQTIYLKSADASGMPSMKIIDYTIRDNPIQRSTQPSQNVTYVTKDEFDSFKSEVQNMMGGKHYEPNISADEQQ